MNAIEQSSELVTQITGPADAPVIIYLPGLHGDWTLMGELRPLLTGRARLVEVAYPHASAVWGLSDYAARLRAQFLRLELPPAHLLAESFGSLVALRYAMRHRECVRSLILAGGVTRSPGALRMALMRALFAVFPVGMIDRMVERFRRELPRRGHDPALFQCLGELFPAGRSARGKRASQRRLEIVQRADLRPGLGELRLPVFYLGGGRDSVVPVRREIKTLRKRLPAESRFRSELLPKAPHPILPARPRECAELIGGWIAECERGSY